MGRSLHPPRDVAIRTPVLVQGGPGPNTDPDDDLPPPWKAEPTARRTPQGRTLEAQASVSAAEWNSLLVWARAQRGPQWDAATGMWQVAKFSDEYYGFSDNPRQLDVPPEERPTETKQSQPSGQGQNPSVNGLRRPAERLPSESQNQPQPGPDQFQGQGLPSQQQWSSIVSGYGGDEHMNSMGFDSSQAPPW